MTPWNGAVSSSPLSWPISWIIPGLTVAVLVD